MIGYFDTSAFIPLLIDEPSSPVCGRLWNDADTVVSSRLLYVEAAAALAQALRLGRLTERQHRSACRVFDLLWTDIDIIDADERVVTRAAGIARTCGLRGYDAVHCASAERISGEDVVVASGDRKVLAACCELGLATGNVNHA
ncbi:MAG TPA: type II toxin-antitoxin system VapC family toxin [Mycobacteriales bacterium]|nr:type II toxin-antitoxin system VapC family toxin [Mycobacteriales bacterium]